MREISLASLTGLRTDVDGGLDLALQVRDQEELWLRFESNDNLNEFIGELRVFCTNYVYRYVNEIEEMISRLPPGEPSS